MVKEVWKVNIKDGHDPYSFDHHYHVFAKSAADAEKKAIKVAIADKSTFEKTNRLSVYSAEFLCNVEA